MKKTESIKTILIVEDEPALLNALSDKLKHEKFNVLTARNGKEGLDLASKRKPDLILLDIIMPVMDGITMLKKLRKTSWGQSANVVVLSNLSGNEKVAEALIQGTHDYLVKTDWRLDEVIKKVRTKLK